MARQNFQKTTDWLLVHEGGYVNHPKDPGGATNFGVIQRTYDAYRQRMGKPKQSVRHIAKEEVWDIYKSQYWDAIHGDLLPDGLDYAVYDFAVNSGPKRAVQFLQRLLHVKDDGIVGNHTLAAIRGHNNIQQLIIDLCNRRWEWMKTLRTFSTFGRGWTRRVMGDVIGAQPGKDHGVIDRGVKLARGMTNIQAPTEAYAGKADEEDTKMTVAAKDSINLENVAKVAGGIVPGAMTAAAALPEGPLQWAAAGIAVLAAVMVAWFVMRKLK